MPAGVQRLVWFVALWVGGVGAVVVVGLVIRMFLGQ
jgi:Protein of unknown function (DUF2474).